MKIIWLHSHFNNWMGGHDYIFEVVKRLKKDCSISVCTSIANDYARKKFNRINICLKEIGVISTNNFLYWLFLPFFINREVRNLKKHLLDADIIISSYFPSNIIANKISRKHLQIMFEPLALFYDDNFIENQSALRKAFLKVIKFFYGKEDIRATKKSDKILTLSEETKLDIDRIYGVNSQITYEGVDTEFFKPTFDPVLSKRYSKNKIIMHCTDFSPIKGTKYLIKALPSIIKRVPNCKLLITNTIENKEEKNRIINNAKNLGVLKNIEFLGFVDYERLPAYYSLASVLVHTGVGKSGATVMSMPVKQALACQTAVVRSPEGKLEVIDRENGYLADPLNTKLLSDRIIKIISNRKLAKIMGIKGRERVIKLFSWEAVTRIIFNNLKELYDNSN